MFYVSGFLKENPSEGLAGGSRLVRCEALGGSG